MKKWVGPVAPPVAAVRRMAIDARESFMMISCLLFDVVDV
jgi:hypothetical protein